MKKTLIIGLITLFALTLISSSAYAVVRGACVNCHTMHNSQNGAPMNWDGSTTPNETLLKGGCFGCHGRGTANNIEFSGTTPQVWHSNATDLAGGNFAYITGLKTRDAGDSGANASTVGHNVGDLGATYYEGTSAMFPPPGNEFSENSVIANSANFTCAGTKGCHGDRTKTGNFAAIKGAHHANDAMLKFGSNFTLSTQGTTTSNSYRFLKGVKGAEVANWQNTDTSHNEYLGVTSGVEATTYSTPGGGTISGLCAECHGNFHGPRAVGSDITNTATGSPWLRHPTDIVLPNSGEYAAYSGTAAYKADAPVGRQATSLPDGLTAPLTSVTPGTDVVMCLSCHGVHATKNADILRWNYSTINAGGGSDTTRCFICHTTKDTGG